MICLGYFFSQPIMQTMPFDYIKPQESLGKSLVEKLVVASKIREKKVK